LRKNTAETVERSDNKKRERTIKTIGGEDSRDDMPPGDYLDGQMENMTDNIGRDWRGTGSGGKM